MHFYKSCFYHGESCLLFEFYTFLKFSKMLQSNNLPNSLNTKHLFQKLYCINPSDLDWSCSSLYRIYFISLDQKNFFTLFGWGSFNNYVDIILPFFDPLPTSTWTFFTLNVDQNWHFSTNYPPHLVHVVFE